MGHPRAYADADVEYCRFQPSTSARATSMIEHSIRSAALGRVVPCFVARNVMHDCCASVIPRERRAHGSPKRTWYRRAIGFCARRRRPTLWFRVFEIEVTQRGHVAIGRVCPTNHSVCGLSGQKRPWSIVPPEKLCTLSRERWRCISGKSIRGYGHENRPLRIDTDAHGASLPRFDRRSKLLDFVRALPCGT